MATPDQIPTTVTNFTWSAFFGLLAVIINGSAFGIWLKTRPTNRKLDIDADQRLREDLISRVEKLERKLDEERAQHEAVVSIMRHRLNNSDQCIEALLLVLDDDDLPPKVKRAVTAIKQMRDRQRSEEAVEKATIQAARIAATTPPAECP
jgi:hypothetical protein